MSKGKKRDLNEKFTDEEERVIQEFLSGKSIRNIAENCSLGRTAIKNLLIAYSKLNPDSIEEIDGKLYANKNHKEKPSQEIKELSEDDIAQIYTQIMNGQITLTKASMETGRNREYIKKRLYTYLGDSPEAEKLTERLKMNQLQVEDLMLFNEYMNLSDDKKKEFIFDRVNLNRAKADRKAYNDVLLNKKFDRIRRYFLITRNKKFNEPILVEDDFWKMLYETPNLLTYSVSDRIDPAMRNLDKNSNIGPENATRIVVEDASILASSISRTNLQIQMLVDYDMLDVFLKRPRCFRTSPELLYALIKLSIEKGNSNKDTLLLTKDQLKSKYGLTTDELKSKYDSREEYGDDEYFEK